jgi:hypothetical protein
MLNTDYFKVENGSATIQPELLKEIAEERDFKNKLPKGFPKESYAVYEDVMDIISKPAGLKLENKGIIVPEKSIRIFGRHDGMAPIENHRLVSHIGTIYMKGKGDKKMSMAVAIACKERGITIAFGTNVWVCTNQCIFGDRIMYTHGAGAIAYDKMMNVLSDYMTHFEEIKETEQTVIKSMMEIDLDYDGVRKIIGELYLRGRIDNLQKYQKSQMLNVSEVGKVFDHIVENQISDEKGLSILDPDFNMNLWDFYNSITTVLNPQQNNDPVNVLEPNSRVTGWLTEFFDIKVPQLN